MDENKKGVLFQWCAGSVPCALRGNKGKKGLTLAGGMDEEGWVAEAGGQREGIRGGPVGWCGECRKKERLCDF